MDMFSTAVSAYLSVVCSCTEEREQCQSPVENTASQDKVLYCWTRYICKHEVIRVVCGDHDLIQKYY